MAVHFHPDDGVGSGKGRHAEKYPSLEDLTKQGWKQIGEMESKSPHSRPPRQWVILERPFAAGEKLRLRTHNVYRPLLIESTPTPDSPRANDDAAESN